ncbi:probable sodium/potassium-transporting ATPase subunit beta-3 [Leguminivora glycinivorella]|uniref:probable sodium/potassium-transporting ATPase subunit beta-3 n=1 Tax=Leguminivora glycinivorella TaxID=1035111 RepID=UPI00200D02E6|nr:probable sodium/potassium-transporting ATPase subunit beta-3 [Leguminivora glycinivorella]
MELNEIRRDPSQPLNAVRIAANGVPGAPNAPKPQDFIPPPVHHHGHRHKRRWYHFCYDKEKKTVCDRTCASWLAILAYSIFYIIFLCVYTLIFLYASLCIIKSLQVYNTEPAPFILYDGPSNIGLTAIPTAVNYKMSLISYKDNDYVKYIETLGNTVSKRQSEVIKQLGPCGVAPFGYGDTPCVLVKINKHYGSSALPLRPGSLNSSDIPPTIKPWASMASKLWLQCSGISPHDTEHMGTVKYYPDPPGFDPGTYSPSNGSDTGLIGVQLSNFTKGLALSIECSLYYEGGKSTVDFVLYVSNSKTVA